MRSLKHINITAYVFSVAIALGVGSLAGYMTRDGMQIYSDIVVPALAPPSVVFPVVWTILYVLMGISAAMIWEDSNPDNKTVRGRALLVYATSLIANFAWCFIFFNFREFGAALIWLFLLWILIFKTIWDYARIRPLAAYLQIPYLIWVSFAGYLTASIWLLN